MQSPLSSPHSSRAAGEPSLSRDHVEQLNHIHGTVNELLDLAKRERGERARLSEKVARLSEEVGQLKSRLCSIVKEFYTVAEVAKLADCSEDTVRRWIKNGKLRATRANGSGPRGRLLVPREALREMLPSGRGENLPAITVASLEPMAV